MLPSSSQLGEKAAAAAGTEALADHGLQGVEQWEIGRRGRARDIDIAGGIDGDAGFLVRPLCRSRR